MSEPESRSLDILGIKPVADAISQFAKATVEGASAFLSRICLPAAEEFGYLLQDRVRAWRASNALRVVAEAEIKLKSSQPDGEVHAHPRIVATIIEQGSWTDDNSLQSMWAGLLASSCTAEGRDDSNLIFAHLLTQITSLQVRVLNYACEKCEKTIGAADLITPKSEVIVDVPTIKAIAGTDDIHRIDQEIDYLRGLELIPLGFDPNHPNVHITPSALALNLYVRCQGYRGSAVDYFRLGANGSAR